MEPTTGENGPTHGLTADEGGERVPGFAAGQSFTITEAAQVTGTSRTTIRRLLDMGELPGAHEAPMGVAGTRRVWRVPLSDLLAAGLTVTDPDQSTDRHTDAWVDACGDQSTHESADQSMDAGGPSSELDTLRARVDDLERLVDAERRRADDLARIADNAQRVAELALRRLGPGDDPEKGPEAPAGAAQAATEGGEGSSPPRGFWSRLFGAGGA